MNQSVGRRRTLLRRLFFWSFTLSAFTVGALALFLAYVPVSWPVVNRRVAAQLERATGLEVEFDSGRLFAPQRRYVVRNLRLREKKVHSEPLLTVERVELTVFPLRLLLGKAPFVDKITLERPSPLQMLYDEHGVAPDEKLVTLARALRGNEPPTSGSSRLGFRAIQVRDATVSFLEREDAPNVLRLASQAKLRDALSLRVGELNAQADTSGTVRAHFLGVLHAAEHDSNLEGVLSVEPNRHVELQLRSPQARLAQLFADCPVEFQAETLDALLRLERRGELLQGKARLLAKSLDFHLPHKDVYVKDEQFELECGVKYDPAKGRATFDKASISSQQLDAALSGEVSLRAPHTFGARLKTSRLGDDYRDLLARYLPSTYSVQANPQSFALDITTTGNLRRMASMTGKLSFTSVTLRSSDYDKPLEQLTGEVEFAPERLVLHNLAGVFGRTAVRFDGVLDGDYLRRGEGTLALRWQASTTADDLMSLVERSSASLASAPLPANTSKGTIESTGTFEQFLSLADPAKTRPAAISGDVRLENVSFSHPQLPAPITQLNGTLAVKDSVVNVEGLRGKMLGNEAQVSGKLQGEIYPWRRPRLGATISAKVDLAEASKYLPEALREATDRLGVQGRVKGDMALATDFRHLDQAELKGKLKLEEVGFEVVSPKLLGRFDKISGDLHWDGTHLRLESVKGELNGAPLSLSGTLSEQEINATITGALDIKAVPLTLPKLEKWLVMSGPAQVNVLFAATTPATGSGAAPVVEMGSLGRLLPLLSSLGERLGRALAERDYTLEGQIALGNDERGAFIRHNSMPGVRTEKGRTIPQGEVSDIHGVVKVSGETLTIPSERPWKCAFGDTKSCSLDGSLEFRRDNFPKIHFNLAIDGEAQMDTWITGWGKEIARPPEPLPTGKMFDLVGHISTPRSFVRGVHTGPLSFTIRYAHVQNKPRHTTISDLRLADQGGSLGAEADIESWPWGGEHAYPRWNVRADIRQMRVARLLGALFGEDPNMDGMITSRMEISGVNKDRMRMRGGGSATMTNLEIGRTPVIRRIGEQTGRSFDSVRFQTAQTASFSVANGVISTEDLRLQSRGIVLEVNGSYSLSREIRAMMRLGLLETVLGNIPLIGDLARMADRVAGRLLLAFRVSGPASNPNIEMIPLPLFQGRPPDRF